jgi:hypothetical protein
MIPLYVVFIPLRLCPAGPTNESPSMRWYLTHIIHERFYCNRRYAAATSRMRPNSMPEGGLALRDLHILFQVCLGLARLRAPVSLGVLAVSPRTVMNNVG